MTINSTFGFESEMEEGADRLVASLINDESIPHLIGDSILHTYHCDCSECRFDATPTYELRGQRDSSCSGELISRIHLSMDTARPVLDAVERHALLVDAIPGWSSGFHVHVGINRYISKYDAFFEYLRWEPFLCRLAAGRFLFLRDANQSVHYMLGPSINEFGAAERGSMIHYQVPEKIEQIRQRPNNALFKQALFDRHFENDRHSHLSLRTRHNTWEFRIFNSTRSAWRMACWIGIARAFMDAQFIEASQRVTFEELSNEPNVAFVAALVASGNPDVADLVAKQIVFAAKETPPPEEFEVLSVS